MIRPSQVLAKKLTPGQVLAARAGAGEAVTWNNQKQVQVGVTISLR